MSNYIKKQIRGKKSEKNPKGMMTIDVIPEVLKETHIISADSGTKLSFHNPSKNVAGKNYSPGTQNLFKQNSGFIKEVHFRIFDLLGVPIYDRVLDGGASPDRLRALAESLNTATVVHKLGEFEIIRDEFPGYASILPNILELASTGTPNVPHAVLSYPSHQNINHLSKAGIGVLGFKYPAKEGLKLTKNEQWTIDVELPKAFAASTYGMQIQCVAICERATDGAV